jgi:ribosomal protein L11 methyltransferase
MRMVKRQKHSNGKALRYIMNNPTEEPQLWQLSFSLPMAYDEDMSDIIYGAFPNITMQQGYANRDITQLKPIEDSEIIIHDETHLPYYIYCQNHDDIKAIDQMLQSLCNHYQCHYSGLTIHALGYEDWLAINRASFQPINVYPFRMMPSGHEQCPPICYPYPLYIDAAAAFGTGHHATTALCLKSLYHMYQRNFRPKTMLDIGTGSGILAIAAQKLWPELMINATDIDDKAVMQAQYNIEANLMKQQGIGLFCSDHIMHDAIIADAPYDLITANILLAPLIMMADHITQLLHHDGLLILSGITQKQLPKIRHIYGRYGWRIVKRLQQEQWLAISLCRKH